MSKARDLANLLNPNGKVEAAKLETNAAKDNLGYTPANKAGDTFTGNVQVSGAVTATGDVTAFGSV